ncbi:MAG: hypothetical protein DI523_06970 [Paraburkholderia fungorum]|nr:MAG: hypothetical protein DI523_06970 [Paraburkholderia fungorum]
MTEFINDAGGKVRTFELLPGRTKRDTWMAPHLSPLQEMVMLNRKELPKDQFKEVEAKWRADRALRDQVARDLAAGKDVSFDYGI